MVKDKNCTLISYKQAHRYHVLEPFMLDLTRQISLCLNENKKISRRLRRDFNLIPIDHQKEMNYVFDLLRNRCNRADPSTLDLCIQGQMRGGFNTIHHLKQLVHSMPFEQVVFSTWDKQAFYPQRAVSLTRVFGYDFIQHLPKAYWPYIQFKAHFPKFIQKLESHDRLDIEEEILRKIHPEIILNIVNEKEFEQQYINKAVLFYKTLNQAKMFYHFGQMKQLNLKAQVILRTRPDIQIDFSTNLNDYVDTLKAQKNLIYISYFDHDLGYGDRFHLGTYDALDKLASIWTCALAFKKLAYLSFFDALSCSKAAEHLLSTHLVALGVRVRYIHSLKEVFLQSDYLSQIPLKDELQQDFAGLVEKQTELQNFYSSLIQRLH